MLEAEPPEVPAGSTGKRGPLRIVIVDDHPVILHGLKGMLAELDGLEVVGAAESGREALAQVETLRPDVVLMDVRLPDMNGLEVTRRIKESWPEVQVVLITVLDSELYLVEALRWGASGYLSKDSSRELIADALCSAARGGTLISTSLVQKAFGALARATATLGPAPSEEDSLPPLVELTPRELDVLRLVSLGRSNRSIGQDLSLAEVTVKKHLQSIMSKMGVSDRTQVALRGVRLGLVD